MITIVINGKFNLFVVGNALLFLIQQQDILPASTQRLTAVVLLHDLYRRDPIAITPFLSVFIQILVRNNFSNSISSQL